MHKRSPLLFQLYTFLNSLTPYIRLQFRVVDVTNQAHERGNKRLRSGQFLESLGVPLNDNKFHLNFEAKKISKC